MKSVILSVVVNGDFMNKFYIAIALVVLIAGGAAAYILIAKPAGDSATKSTDSVTVQPLSSVTACDILTEDVAKALLGEDIDRPDSTIGDASNTDISVTNCGYNTKITATSSASLPKISGVTLLARVAKTPAGAQSNTIGFEDRPSGVENVEGIGDSAFYSPDFRQLNVLKGDNWYIVTYYVDSIMNASLETNKQLAEKLTFK